MTEQSRQYPEWAFEFPDFNQDAVTGDSIFARTIYSSPRGGDAISLGANTRYQILYANDRLELAENVSVGRYLIARKIVSDGTARICNAPTVVTQDFTCDEGCQFGDVYVSAGGVVSLGKGTYVDRLVTGPGVTVNVSEGCIINHISFYEKPPVITAPEGEAYNADDPVMVEPIPVFGHIGVIFSETCSAYYEWLLGPAFH